MAADSTAQESLTVPLSGLFLDPNNFRFIHEETYVKVPEDKILSPDVQRRTTVFILGEREENVRDLLDSFKKNGFLPVDQIQARKVGEEKYLIVEGNRRVAALKFLEGNYNTRASDLGKLDPSIFKNVPVNIYQDAGERHLMVLAALRHISGNKKWPAINQARLLARLRDEEGMSADDVCQLVGISKHELTRSLRALALSDTYIASEYGRQFTIDKYNLFLEVTNSPVLRGWLGWSDDKRASTNAQNQERLFSLVSEVEEVEEEGTATIKREPAILTGGNVRELARLLGDPKAMARLEESRSFINVTFASDVVLLDRVERSLDSADEHASELFKLLPHFRDADVARVQTIIDRFQGLLVAKKRPPRIFGRGPERSPFNQDVREHFSEVRLDRWRGFHDVPMRGLRRINVIGGVNNAGKTSLLEAIYLLSQQADTDALFEVVARRAKVGRDVDPRWFLEQVPEGARVSGVFDTVADHQTYVSVEVDRSAEGVDDTFSYQGSITVEAGYRGGSQSEKILLYEKREPVKTAHGSKVLCRAILSSPFSMHDPDVLVEIHKRSVETKSKQKIIDFLRDKLDDGVSSIELVDDLRRFLVTHRDFDKSPDLTQFGEGFQRIFHIALLFAYAEHGVVLIDELDNAVHVGVLEPFARLLHELAERFHAQVFVTTHSRECIRACVGAEDIAKDVSYFGIGIHGKERFLKGMPGEQLQRLMEIGDVDPRWVR